MQPINRILTNICSNNLEASCAFYTKLFDFEIAYSSDWFMHLRSSKHQLELGIIARNHDLVPAAYQQAPQGFYITFVVDDVEAIYALANRENLPVIQAPSDTFYGQRRLLLKDPDGALIDVSAPMSNFNQ